MNEPIKASLHRLFPSAKDGMPIVAYVVEPAVADYAVQLVRESIRIAAREEDLHNPTQELYRRADLRTSYLIKQTAELLMSEDLAHLLRGQKVSLDHEFYWHLCDEVRDWVEPRNYAMVSITPAWQTVSDLRARFGADDSILKNIENAAPAVLREVIPGKSVVLLHDDLYVE